MKATVLCIIIFIIFFKCILSLKCEINQNPTKKVKQCVNRVYKEFKTYNNNNNDNNNSESVSSNENDDDNNNDYTSKRMYRNQGNSRYKRSTGQQQHQQEENNYDRHVELLSLENKICDIVINCFYKDFNLTSHGDYRNRQVVTQAFIKNIKNRQLSDFYGNLIHQCFRAVESSGDREKCKISIGFFICLSEGTRSNCDDWENN